MCSRIALLYLDILYHCYTFTSVEYIVRRIFELGLGNKTFMASYSMFFRDKDFSQITFGGMPMSVFFHEDGLNMCHEMLEYFGCEVRLVVMTTFHILWYITVIVNNILLFDRF